MFEMGSSISLAQLLLWLCGCITATWLRVGADAGPVTLGSTSETWKALRKMPHGARHVKQRIDAGDWALA